jgi:hypothetical protein
MKNIAFLGFVFFTLCGLAHAEENKGGFFIEPSLTYELEFKLRVSGNKI